MRIAAGHDGLIALFEREGYARVEPPVLQPADVFLDLSGEDIRRRIFVTQDAAGRELCLRPEYTIPVCREHLAGAGPSPANYSYLGPVFRLRAGETGEFLHAGIESIGRRDAAAADAGLLAAIEGQAPHAARAFVEDILSIAGISTVGGRSPGEIAERFLARAANRTGSLSDEARSILTRYLAIDGDPDAAAASIRALARDAGLDLARAIDTLEERTGFMAVHGLDIASFRFFAAFARSLDYYTGFIFEIADSARADDKPLVGGGRYDRLLQHLGAAESVAAVGCSFWLERIGE